MRASLCGKVLFLIAAVFIGQDSLAYDLFNQNEPASYTSFQRLPPTSNLRGYPIPGFGNEQTLLFLWVAYSTGLGSGIPLGSVHAADIRGKKYFAGIQMTGNLSESTFIGDWTDEPCKREGFLWKRSIGGKFQNINCATITHTVRYYETPTSEYQRVLVHFREQGIELPPTIVRVEFTRSHDRGRRLVYRFDFNPELFGIERDAERLWGSSGWHKAFIEKDPKRVEFLASLTRWAEDMQDRMDRAFNKEVDAFAGMRSFQSYFKQTALPVAAQSTAKPVEERLQDVKQLDAK